MPAVPRGIQEFLDGYPDFEDDLSLSANLEFYSNKRRCKPDNCLIEEIHEHWRGDYSKLEYKHGFIQWLFPIKEFGMNYESQPLQQHEVDAMKANKEIVARVLRSYRLMLDFYGMDLISAKTGLLKRVEPAEKNETRYRNLVRSGHNYLRISRILKHLSEMGLERLNAGFLLHVLNEQSENAELNSSGIRSSMDQFWANCLRNKEERKWIGQLIEKVREGGEFVFTREMYEQALARREETGSFAEA
ncbi:opioid growth factor receptor conserved domain-containing protein [Cristinia sonorae]|uniref:Opioid growth factor receptor conserved domain-containing protein n=1 Tax=Cristinia sonorae TaxID=1940300 RepID=A0A8K0XSX8_9AGAR|nr:opioid growth factor receptor conserved domain-containing protein [Cristinia sonorae]